MDEAVFEALLDRVVAQLALEARQRPFDKSGSFETRVREVLRDLGGVSPDFNPHPYAFPDIVVGRFGVEVKFTTNDTWRSVANSVFESTRDRGVLDVYIVFGKMGGVPGVQWGRYEDCVMHVRTSHVPRFEVEIGTDRPLFPQMGLTYDQFREASLEEKMRRVRQYARGRLKEGERLWWLEDKPDGGSLPPQVRLYMHLPQEEKRKLRAEAALLCPQIVAPPRARRKYNDATMYILTTYGVLCPQARDLFSAGSVALRSDGQRGGHYIARALRDLEPEMREAARGLSDETLKEYWGASCEASRRIGEWLRRADSLAEGWKPSEELFVKDREGGT